MIDQRTAAYGALLLRVSLGVMFLAHGLLKLLVFTPAGTAKFFASLGYPPALAYGVIAAELLGGALLVLGVYARVAALALVPLLIGAAQVHLGNGWVFSAQGGGWEFPVFWIAAALVQALIGDGALALRPTPAFGSGSAKAPVAARAF